jgi:hypothetical protein
VSVSIFEVSDTIHYDYRASATANRSLPDIPVDSQRVQLESGDTLWENSENNGDTSSELYATVEEDKRVVQLVGEYHSTDVSVVSCYVCHNSVYLQFNLTLVL